MTTLPLVREVYYGSHSRTLRRKINTRFSLISVCDNKMLLAGGTSIMPIELICHLQWVYISHVWVLILQELTLTHTSSIIQPNLKYLVYCTAIANGGEEEWNFAWEKYLASNVAAEKNKLIHALGCTKKIWMLSRWVYMMTYFLWACMHC